MLSCRQVVEALSGETESSFSAERLQLKMHLLMCKYGNRYFVHLKMLARGAKKLLEKKAQVNLAVIKDHESEVIETFSRDPKE